MLSIARRGVLVPKRFRILKKGGRGSRARYKRQPLYAMRQAQEAGESLTLHILDSMEFMTDSMCKDSLVAPSLQDIIMFPTL